MVGILLVVLIIYNILLLVNTRLDDYILKEVEDRIQAFLDANDIVLDNRGELIMEALTFRLIEELQSEGLMKYVPLVGIVNDLKTIRYLEEDIGQHLFFLRQCYGDMLFSKENMEGEKEDTEQTYFISIEKNNKYLTIWFKYDGKRVGIIDASETVKSLSLKDQYSLLYKGLKDLLNKKEGINCSLNLEETLDDEMLNGFWVGQEEVRERKLIK